MELGDLVFYRGRPCYLRGVEPMSLPERRALLEDAETGERFDAPVDELEPVDPDEQAGTTRV
jgi:hypothetical protein